MAVFETSRALNDGVRTTSLIASFMGAVIDWNDRRMTRKALLSLSTRELDDIGLSRGDVYNM